MTNYIEEAEGRDFTDLVDNTDFQRDLVRFFSSSRYNMSPEEIRELGPQGLAERFVEHMRWQNTNEYTAMQDLFYVNDTENRSERELQAFGNLITAYDRVDGGGTGVLSGAWDYLSAFATAPSTLATAATAGWGAGSKIAARAAGRSAQAAIRSQVANLVHQGVARGAVQDAVAGTVSRGAVRGAVSSAAVEGAVGAGQAAMLGEIREGTGGEEYNTTDLLRDATISAVAGGALGSAARALDVRTQRRVIGEFADRASAANQARQAARQAANDRLSNTPADVAAAATERTLETVNTLTAREQATRLDPLDPELVERGNVLRREILGGANTDRSITSSLSVDTLRGITAATVDIAEELKVNPNERISSAVARGLQEGSITTDRLDEIRNTYNLSREEMSYIYLSDLSRAGRVLAEASYIRRATDRAGRDAAMQTATRDLQQTVEEIGRLADTGLSTLSEAQAAEVVASTYKTDRSALAKAFEGLQELDAVRIAFMTSQVGTTMANTATSLGNVFVDMSNQFWKSFANATVGREVGGQVQRQWTGGVFSTLRGLTLDDYQARVARGLLEESYPTEFANLFFETGRAEAAMESQSGLARVGRFVNTFNTAVDSTFKQASFYSGLDRRLRELNNPQVGRNFGEFMATGRRLDDLPREIVEGAIDDARRFTFQKTYQGDKSAFGTAARALERAHRKLPFVISAGVGVPFPRYLANHLEHISDYTPLGVLTGGLNRLDSQAFGDAFKTGQDRFARQMTGLSLVMMGYGAASYNEGEIDYDSLLTETGELDLSRTGGPFLAPVFLGNLLYRYRNGMNMPQDVPAEFMELALGMGDLGLDTSAIAAIRESVEEGSFTPALQEFLGNVAATFTYPLTITRDFQAALNPESAPTPFTRDVFMGSPDELSMAGEATGLESLNYLDVIQMRATRFLPDWDILQYTQTLNGRNDIPQYTIFNEVPVGAFNPLSRQMGFASTPRPNEIQRELSRLGLRDYELYSSRSIRNPLVAYIVEARLSQTLNDRFVLWAEGQEQGIRAGGVPYNQIQDPSVQRDLFIQFVNEEVRAEVEETEHLLDQAIALRPRAVSGYIRNMYVIREAQLSSRGGSDVYDQAVSTFSEEFDTAADALRSVSTVEEELAMRRQIMIWAEDIAEPAEGLDR